MTVEEVPLFYNWAIHTPFWYGRPYGEPIPTYEQFIKDWKKYSRYLFSKMNIRLCWLDVVAKNSRAIRAHKKAGFKATKSFVEDEIKCLRMELEKPAMNEQRD
jgi:hypothetical protein